jgi:dihydropteroate synthase
MTAARALARLAGVPVGDDHGVVVMGALNVSPESFYGGSVVSGRDRLLRAAEAMVAAGARLIDVGAQSTAPGGAAAIGPEEEADRLGEAVGALAGKLDVPLSADTSRAAPARAALEAGARVINDVTGLTGDREVARLAAEAGAGAILVASERGGARPGEARGRPAGKSHGLGVPPEGAAGPGLAATLSGPPCSRSTRADAVDPVETVLGRLRESLDLALEAGLDPGEIVVDPGIGFFRRGAMAWYEWDCRVLGALARLRPLGRPVCVGVSRKSFIGAVAEEADPARRLPGSLAATAAAVLAGAHLIRSHDVAETLQAVRVAQAVRRAMDAA